jgi:hypothetical protein
VNEYLPNASACLLLALILDAVVLEHGERRPQAGSGERHVIDDAGSKLALRPLADDVHDGRAARVEPGAIEAERRTWPVAAVTATTSWAPGSNHAATPFSSVAATGVLNVPRNDAPRHSNIC